MHSLIPEILGIQVMYWLGEMCDELQEKLDIDLEVHNRKAKLLVFHAAVQLVRKLELHYYNPTVVTFKLFTFCFLYLAVLHPSIPNSDCG